MFGLSDCIILLIGIFLSVTMNDKVTNTNGAVSIPVTWGELEVIRSIANYHIPLLLGFGSYAPIIQSEDQSSSSMETSTPPVW